MELPLNKAHIVVGGIFSMQLSNFRARGPKSIPMTVLTKFFFPEDTEKKVHSLPVSLYFF